VPIKVSTAGSLMTLATVSSEISFIAGWLADYGDAAPPVSERVRIKAALTQAQTDLNHVIARILAKPNMGDGGQDNEVGQQTV
jgi:hypothetical protein